MSGHIIPYTTRANNSYVSVAGEALAYGHPGVSVTVVNDGPDLATVTIIGYLVDVP